MALFPHAARCALTPPSVSREHTFVDSPAASFSASCNTSNFPPAWRAPKIRSAPRRPGGIIRKRGGAMLSLHRGVSIYLIFFNEQVYSVVDEAAHKAAGGLPVVRVAQALIKAPIEDVALCWWQAGRRKVGGLLYTPRLSGDRSLWLCYPNRCVLAADDLAVFVRAGKQIKSS